MGKKVRKTFVKAWNYKWIYLMLLPVVVYFVIFKYVPMYGITIAFKDYNIFKGMFESPWVGLDVFEKIFANKNFWSAIKNTFILNLSSLAVSFPLTIIVSLMLNELGSAKFKKVTQSILYLPHFVSWVVVAGIATNMFALQDGTINAILERLGVEPVPFLSDNGWWIFTYIVCNVWKEIGWGTIIYLAALTGVDETLYEAAYLDGASKFQQAWYITVPHLRLIMAISIIMAMGSIFRGDFGLFYVVTKNSGRIYDVTDVIDTYIYRGLTQLSNVGMSTAAGLYQSVVGFIMVLFANWVVTKIDPDSAMF